MSKFNRFLKGILVVLGVLFSVASVLGFILITGTPEPGSPLWLYPVMFACFIVPTALAISCWTVIDLMDRKLEKREELMEKRETQRRRSEQLAYQEHLMLDLYQELYK